MPFDKLMENPALSDMERLAEKAKGLLAEKGCTLAACAEDDTVLSNARGVKPLLDMLDAGVSLSRYAVADKVVGRAAAFLYALLGARYIHAGIVSTPALEVFTRLGISCTCGTEVDAIKNRTNTGLCPMESAVRSINDPAEAEKAIRETLERLSSA